LLKSGKREMNNQRTTEFKSNSNHLI